MEDVINLFVNNSVSIGVVIYFLWKDMTLTKENSEILSAVKTLLETMIEKKCDS